MCLVGATCDQDQEYITTAQVDSSDSDRRHCYYTTRLLHECGSGLVNTTRLLVATPRSLSLSLAVEQSNSISLLRFQLLAMMLTIGISIPFINPRIFTKPSPFLSHFPSSSSPQLLRFAARFTGSELIQRRKSSIVCSAENVTAEENENVVTVKKGSVSVILLAGGKGKRMGASMPKQYLPLVGQPIALYSFFQFAKMDEVKEIVVVCDPSYKDVFEDANEKIQVVVKYALPGKERQDSVFSGLQAIDPSSELVCIHDSARPLISSEDIKKVLKDGLLYGAAVLGVPAKATIKEANSDSFVVRTLDRSTLWEMQTPQIIKPELLIKGFELVYSEGLVVTDDVSIVEHLKHPVYITEGSYTNIKVTTPEDMLLAEGYLNKSTHVSK